VTTGGEGSGEGDIVAGGVVGVSVIGSSVVWGVQAASPISISKSTQIIVFFISTAPLLVFNLLPVSVNQQSTYNFKDFSKSVVSPVSSKIPSKS